MNPMQKNGVGDISDSKKEIAINDYGGFCMDLANFSNVYISCYRQISMAAA